MNGAGTDHAPCTLAARRRIAAELRAVMADAEVKSSAERLRAPIAIASAVERAGGGEGTVG